MFIFSFTDQCGKCKAATRRLNLNKYCKRDYGKYLRNNLIYLATMFFVIFFLCILSVSYLVFYIYFLYKCMLCSNNGTYIESNGRWRGRTYKRLGEIHGERRRNIQKKQRFQDKTWYDDVGRTSW